MDGITILVWIAIGAICYAVAERKNRSPIIWAALGFLFSAIALIVLLILPPVPDENKNGVVGKMWPDEKK